MRDHTDLHKFQQKVDMYFDNALSHADEKDLFNTIAHDSSCKQVFHQAKNYRSFIKDHVHRPKVSPDFIKNLKDKIRVV